MARRYGIITSGVNSLHEYFLLDDGSIVDSDGDVRYKPVKKQKYETKI